MLEEKGWQETKEYLEQQGAHWRVEDNVTDRFNPESVWAMELSLVEGALLLKTLGVDKKRCRRLLTEIRAVGLAFEKEYKGKDSQGPLVQWYLGANSEALK